MNLKLGKGGKPQIGTDKHRFGKGRMGERPSEKETNSSQDLNGPVAK